MDETERRAPPVVVAPHRAPRDPFRSLRAMVERQGDVARYRAGSEEAFLLNQPDLVRHVLAEGSANFTKDTFVNANFREWLADGLLVSEGERWRRRRQLVQPAFHRERLSAFAGAMVEATVRITDRWQQFIETGEPMDLAAEMGTLTLLITSRVLFGVDLAHRADGIGRTIAEGMRGIISPHQDGFRTGRQKLLALVADIVDQRRRDRTDHADVVSMLIEARDASGRGLTRDEILEEVVTLLLAGHETTANALAWTWVLLISHPWAMRELQAELDAVLGGRCPLVADLPLIPYARMVFEESLRLYPPAWILGRRALSADVIGGRQIPAGSVVAISPYLLHRHPEFWPDPDRFDPTRFAPESAAVRRPFSFLPFGGGPRVCIGRALAMTEAQLVIATIASRFRFELLAGYAAEPERLFVLRPRGGVPVLVSPR
jgi:cytochrome P450